MSLTAPSPSAVAPKESLVAPLALFDLDRTLLHGSSLARLGRALAEAGVVRRATLARHLIREARFAAAGLGPTATHRLQGSLLRAATNVERQVVLDVVHQVAPAIAATIYSGARWLVDRHLAEGHRVVLLSASPQELVAAIAATIDRHIIPVGTCTEVVDGRLTGKLDGVLCYGAGKLVRLRQEVASADMTRATAYADSCSDLPVLVASASPIAVNPDRRLRAIAKTHRWPILHFV